MKRSKAYYLTREQLQQMLEANDFNINAVARELITSACSVRNAMDRFGLALTKDQRKQGQRRGVKHLVICKKASL
jgi:transcriptional regulator with GAF, ATPase, and Fis domain